MGPQNVAPFGDDQPDVFAPGTGGPGGPVLARLLPGGAAPGPVELGVGLLVLGALAWIVLIRRGFKDVLGS